MRTWFTLAPLLLAMACGDAGDGTDAADDTDMADDTDAADDTDMADDTDVMATDRIDVEIE